jgi:peptidyl-prolyl cis-trans isomerase SurA
VNRFAAPVLLAALLCLGSAASPLVAQQTAGDTASETIDRIAAVVGGSAILRSQVDEELLTRRQEGVTLPKDSAGILALRRQILDTLIAVELLYQQAQTDTTVKVTDQEVNDGAEQQYRRVRSQFNSVDQFNTELKADGFQSGDDWREWLKDQQRRNLYITRYRKSLEDDGSIKPINPTEKEMRAFYDANLDHFSGQAAVSLRQIVISPKADSAAHAKTLALADSIIGELRKKGADEFALAARRFSMDEGSKYVGGDVGWFQHGKMVPQFETAAFSLPEGQISNPVESSYGIHIIQVIRKAPTEVHARHILLIPEVDSADAAKAHALADSIHAALVRGASFDSLQKLYTDPVEERDLPEYPIDSLQPNYKAALVGVDSGKVTPVFTLPAPDNSFRTKYAILEVTGTAAAGVRPYESESVKALIRRVLADQLGQAAYINDLRAKTYVDIRVP